MQFITSQLPSLLLKLKTKAVPALGQNRQLWGWLNSVFNRYDQTRVDEVGPDRACAEWLIRCGCGIKWNRDSDWFRDYNSLPVSNFQKLKIVEIDATDSAVMHIGFRHFQGLQHCEKITFHKAGYLEDEALKQLPYLKHCLKDLQISSCGNITDEGLLSLADLTSLEKLLLYDLPEVRNKTRCIEVLQNALPKCNVDFRYAQASELKTKTDDK